MAISELHAYVKQALDVGAPPAEIKKRLLTHGWNEHDIEEALQGYLNPPTQPKEQLLGPHDQINVEYASPKQRLAAFMLDYMILLPLNLLVLLIIWLYGRESVPIIVPIQAVIIWFYFSLQESSSASATFGKKLLGLYIARSNGEDIDFRQSSIRLVVKTISFIPLGAGVAYLLFNPKHQAVYDLAADTVVPLRDPKPKPEQIALYQTIGMVSFYVLIILPIVLAIAVFVYEQIKPPSIPANTSPSTETSAVAESRDASRKTDIATYATELGLYFQARHSYPVSSNDSSDSSNGVFSSTGPLSSVSTTFPDDPLNGQNRCQLASISPKKVCAYHYLSNGSSYILWAILELPGSGGGVFFTDSNNSRGLLTSEPTAAP